PVLSSTCLGYVRGSCCIGDHHILRSRGADCHWSQALRVKAFRTVSHWVSSVVCHSPLRLLPFAVLDTYTVSSASWVCCVWIDTNCRDSNFSDRNSTSDVQSPITNRKDAAMARLRHWTRNSNRF